MRYTKKHAAALILLNLILLLAVAGFSLITIVSARGLKFDFYPHWVGGQAFWRGQTPYTPEITAAIQQGMFGNVLPDTPEFDQQNVAYPAYASVILAPIIWLPAPLAIAVWMALQFLAIIWAMMIWLVILKWRPAPWLLGILVLACLLLFRYPINVFVLGQFTGIILFWVSLGILLMLHQRLVLAGVVFALATVPPTIGAPLALVILGVYALRGRWHGLAALFATIAVLVGVSILRIGWWIPDFISVLNRYAQYATPVWAPALIEWPAARVLFVVLIIAFCAFIFARFWRNPLPEQQIDVAITMLITSLLLLPQTGNYYMVLLIPPLLACIYRAQTMRWIIWLACALAIISPWLYWRFSGEASQIEALLLPLYVGLIWISANYSRWSVLNSTQSARISQPIVQDS